MSNEKDHRSLSKFLERIRSLAESLPTNAEKEEARSSLSQLIDFLNDVRGRLAALPSKEDASQARAAIQEMEGLILKASTNPTLAAALGFRKETRKRPRVELPSPEENNRAKEALGLLESLPADEIQRDLSDEEKYPNHSLRAIALQLGIKATTKTSRDALIHQVTTRIANYRGYKELSGQPKPTDN